mmetsp:Transcript_62923/g.166916  ORF Transcript_62923/g.166916 Transcript_62923/m.166916 type:complete len:298 (+) Transcript_62923:1884-2777(+)
MATYRTKWMKESCINDEKRNPPSDLRRPHHNKQHGPKWRRLDTQPHQIVHTVVHLDNAVRHGNNCQKPSSVKKVALQSACLHAVPACMRGGPELYEGTRGEVGECERDTFEEAIKRLHVKQRRCWHVCHIANEHTRRQTVTRCCDGSASSPPRAWIHALSGSIDSPLILLPDVPNLDASQQAEHHEDNRKPDTWRPAGQRLVLLQRHAPSTETAVTDPNDQERHKKMRLRLPLEGHQREDVADETSKVGEHTEVGPPLRPSRAEDCSLNGGLNIGTARSERLSVGKQLRFRNRSKVS